MDGLSPRSVTAAEPEAEPPSGRPARWGFAKTRAFYRRIEAGLFMRRRNDGSVAIALLMVVVAIATGPVTYLVTDHASKATATEDARLHDAIEEGYLQRTIQSLLEHEQRTFLAYARHHAQYRAHLASARDAGADVEHQFDVQSERDQLLAVRGQFQWALPVEDGAGEPEYPTDDARASLEDQLEGGRLQELTGSAGVATARANAERQTSLWLVGVILALVGALLLLTAAQVTPRRPRRLFAVVGSIVALVAVAAVIFVDGSPIAWWIAVVTATLFAAIVVGERFAPGVRRRFGRRLRPDATVDLIAGDTGARGPSLLPIADPGEMGSIFARGVAIAIAAGTLCGAWIGYLQADAFGRSDTHGFRAQQHALEALNVGEQAENNVLAQLEAYGLATESIVAMWGAQHLVRYQPEGGSTDAHHDAEAKLAEARMTGETMDRLANLDAGAFGPSSDPDFPTRMTADAARGRNQQTARQLLDDADSRDWEGRGNFYVRWLVVLAVAVYLLGLAVVIPGEGVKVLFLLAGGGGVVVAVAVTAWTLLNHPRSAQEGATDRVDAAAVAYAEGRYRLAIRDFPGAVTAFSTAVYERPDFGRAHAQLSSAAYLEGTTQTTRFVSVSTPAAVSKAIEHHIAASRTGSNNFAVQAGLGYENLLASLQTAEGQQARDLRKASLEASDAATRLLPSHPLPHFNIALAYMIEGDTAAANAAYADAIRLTRRGTATNRVSLLASALTDLEVVRGYRRDLTTLADANQERLIRELSGPAPLTGEAIARSKVTTSLLPTTLSWRARLTGLDPLADTVVQVWYRRAHSRAPWATHSDVDMLEVGARRGPDSFVLLLEPDSIDLDYRGEVDVAAGSTTCLPDGQYRVDLYVNGWLAARSEPMTRLNANSPDVGAVAWWVPDVGLFACVPPGWTRVAGADREPGHVDAVRSRDRSSGLVFARVQYGGPLAGADRATAVLDSIRSTGLSVVPAGLERDRGSENGGFFLGNRNDQTQIWRSDEVEYRAQAGVTDEGTVLLAILYGPTGFLATDAARLGPVGSSYVRVDELWGLRRPTSP